LQVVLNFDEVIQQKLGGAKGMVRP